MRKMKIEDLEEGRKERIQPIDNIPTKKNCLVPIILIALLLGAVGYIAYDKWQDYSEKQKEEIFILGVQTGISEIVLEIFNKAITCEGTIPLTNIDPITNQSLTINLIAAECLQTRG